MCFFVLNCVICFFVVFRLVVRFVICFGSCLCGVLSVFVSCDMMVCFVVSLWNVFVLMRVLM